MSFSYTRQTAISYSNSIKIEQESEGGDAIISENNAPVHRGSPAHIDLVNQRKWVLSIKSLRKPTENNLFASKWAIRAFTTSCIILIVLIICNVPLAVLLLIEEVRGSVKFRGKAVILSLPYLSSLINPVIYLWRIPEFRRAVTRKCKSSN